MAKDFYAILGVAKTASESEIKAAYRKLSRELHPDKHKGDKTKEAKFKEVNEAYEVLSDAKKRQAYDQFGSTNGNPFGAGFGGFQDFDSSSFGGGFGDIFEAFFGGQRGARPRESVGQDIEVEVTIPLMLAVTGEERDVRFRTFMSCDACAGSGAASGAKRVTCDQCGGSGQMSKRVNSLFGVIQQAVVCDRCAGAGTMAEHACKTCAGQGRVQKEKSVRVRIPPGISDGQALRVTGEGEAGKFGARSGDLYVRIRIPHDGRFERDGDDIHTSLTIDVIDAALGAKKHIETVHGTVTLDIHAGTQPGSILRVKGKGMPILNTSRQGDHYVKIAVHVPEKLSRKERELLEEWRTLR